MARFNTTLQDRSDVVNLAGGKAHSQKPELELVSILLTSFANDQFYRSANDTFNQLKNLIQKCDPEFVAKAAVYARTQFGMRSITHVVASELARHVSGKSWAVNFYNSVVYRPDDMMEILSYHTQKNGKPSKAMLRGFAKAFDKFDRYSLAKYRGEGRGFKLVDVVNIVHPAHNETIEALVKGELKSFDTWETDLSKAGQLATNEDEKAELKKEVWIKLIQERKLGYFALLKNLRNIIEQAPEIITEALAMLTDETLIKKSLVLPFRFLTAGDEIAKLNNGKIIRQVLIAINKAVDISVSNVPVFDGETCVVLDVSGSMEGKPSSIGSLFSAVLVKSNNADFMTFDTEALYRNVNPMDSTLTIASSMKFNGGGTDFHCIFGALNKKYDRIIILSDMQGWIGYDTPRLEFNQYKGKTGANPFIYSFDLQGYGSMQFPENKVFCVAGFSDKIFDIMAIMEQGRNALIDKIKEISFI